MKSFNLPIDLIIQIPLLQTRCRFVSKDLNKQHKDAGIDAELVNEPDVISKKKDTYQKNLSMTERNVLVKTKTSDTEINPWDLAHLSADAIHQPQ